ncbi:TauD/TfdA family dioxygenase [Streptomyces sp. TG1A-8]|uniref:TauD/TfdA family dioxygenase n=1 Tax=Streptomyces sp. TG1A-8 TaxID=3051385 RepID=UPI00265C6C16|nr:TauD/TfdA family dioxygenase [Streptomyces sp. TG1A-8]MDO0924684.1 TauD/TfdA family dioxygenase [Streptomyces sp. TG1A-8]
MRPIHALDSSEHDELYDLLASVGKHPYEDYAAFSRAITDLIDQGRVPAFFTEVCVRVKDERRSGVSQAHVLRNVPIDAEVPVLDHDDPVSDKHRKKKTFVGEALLELFNQLVGTPLLTYARNRGDFFTDVVAYNRFDGMFTGYSDSELYFHNDRTAHPVRADYISLLGMRCPDDVIYTGYVDGTALLEHLDEQIQETLRRPYFVTSFDVFSREFNATLTESEKHAILYNDHSFRYMDTATTVATDAPIEARDAIIAVKDALAKADKQRHRILTGDLFVLANQDGMHSREKIEIHDPVKAKSRWLLKTYAFRDDATADSHADAWVDSVRGRVAD